MAQYFADLLDGEVGRRRNTGLVKWGFYMDHLSDFIFVCTTVVGYGLVFPEIFSISLIILAIFAIYFTHNLLACIVLGEYDVTGSTETRLALIAFNLFIFFSKRPPLKSQP